MSNKTKILFLGNSSFLQRRILPSIKKINSYKIFICSNSSKINSKKLIRFNDYKEAINSKPDIVYITLINKLHYKWAKYVLKKGCHLIVDKPITKKLSEAKELLKLAKKRRLLLVESTLFNFHNVFNKIEKILGGNKEIVHIQSNFNIPTKKSLTQINKIDGDNIMDMSAYASAMIRLYLNRNNTLKVSKIFFKNSKIVKSFCVLSNDQKKFYFGNFGTERKYLNNIIFFSKKKIVSLNNQAFALRPNKKVSLSIQENNTIKKLFVPKDDCIKNFMRDILKTLKTKNFNKYYDILLYDAKIREKLRQ